MLFVLLLSIKKMSLVIFHILLNLVAHTWIEETRNASKERKSNQMWGITYFQQSEDSPTTRLISRTRLNFISHIVLVVELVFVYKYQTYKKN